MRACKAFEIHTSDDLAMHFTKLFLALIFLSAAPAFAQSGSAGGSIGNDDKSISGTRESRPAATAPLNQPAKSRPTPAPQASRRGGGSGGGPFDGNWTFSGTSTNCQGSGTGAFTVSGTRVTVASGGGGSVSSSGAFQATTNVEGGVTLTATGRLSGSSGGGSYTRSDGCVGRWTASR